MDALEIAKKHILKKDIVEMKTNCKPVDIIKLVLDALQILQSKKIVDVKPRPMFINKTEAMFIADSFSEYTKTELNNICFLADIENLSVDSINDETCELLEPYLRFDEDPIKNWGPWPFQAIDPELAAKASGAAKGMCLFIRAAVHQHATSRKNKVMPSSPCSTATPLQHSPLSEAASSLSSPSGSSLAAMERDAP